MLKWVFTAAVHYRDGTASQVFYLTHGVSLVGAQLNFLLCVRQELLWESFYKNSSNMKKIRQTCRLERL